MNAENHNSQIISELSNLILKGNAHASFEEAVKDIPLNKLTEIPEHLPYNLWQLTEHIRIAQWDIVEFCMNPNHKSPEWPDEYWVSALENPDKNQWTNTLEQVKTDRDRFLAWIKTPSVNLYQPLAHGTGQNIFREALLIVDHTAYHVGEIILLRRLLQIWE